MALPKMNGSLAALGGPPASDAEDTPMDGGTAVAEMFLEAVESKDPAAVKSAFKAMYDECMAGGEMDEGLDA